MKRASPESTTSCPESFTGSSPGKTPRNSRHLSRRKPSGPRSRPGTGKFRPGRVSRRSRMTTTTTRRRRRRLTPKRRASREFDLLGRGGSSSGSTSDNGSRGPGFDSHWELGFFSLFSFSFSSVNQWSVLNQFPWGGATLLILKKF